MGNFIGSLRVSNVTGLTCDQNFRGVLVDLPRMKQPRTGRIGPRGRDRKQPGPEVVLEQT